MTICCISRKKLFTITICKKLLWTTICKSCLEGQFSKQDLSRKLMWSLLCLCGLVLRYFQWMIHGYMEKWHWIIHWFDFVRKHGHAREYATQLESTSESAICSPQISLSISFILTKLSFSGNEKTKQWMANKLFPRHFWEL